VPVAELKRLGGLLAGVGTIEAAVDRFGTPDFQSFAENKSVEPKVGDSGRIQARLRKIVYSGLSSWVDVALIETVDRGVHIAFLSEKEPEGHSKLSSSRKTCLYSVKRRRFIAVRERSIY